MHHCNNFGMDNPSYWPQPFHPIIGHLAVIPCPQSSPNHELYYAWYEPQPSNFVPLQRTGMVGIGSLAPVIISGVQNMCDKLLGEIQKIPSTQQQDQYLVSQCNQICKLIERLSLPGSEAHVFLQLSCLQCVFLKTFARLQWTVFWWPCLYDVDQSFPVDPHVMGAFTEDLDIAANLFRMGIPVWIVHPLNQRVTTCIICQVIPLDKTWDFELPLHDSDRLLNVSHNSPAHALIYTGLPGSYK
jgi:hypothetical protein